MTQKTISAASIAAVVGVIDPDVTAAGTVTTGWISMAMFQEVQAIVLVGTLGSSATIDAKIEQATDGSGAGAKDVDGLAITQLTQAGTNDSDKQAVLELSAEDRDVNNNFSHARLSVTVGTASSDVGAVVMGMSPRYDAAYVNDLASVAEIVRA